MAKSTTNKIKLTKRGAFQRTTTAAGKNKWAKVAPRIQLRAIGARLDSTHLAEIRFRPLKGKIRSEFVDWSLMITEKRTELKARLAALGYDWPKDKATSDAVWAAVVGTRPKKEFLSVSTPGWHGGGFVLPGKFFCSDVTAVPVIIDQLGRACRRVPQRRRRPFRLATNGRKTSPKIVAITGRYFGSACGTAFTKTEHGFVWN
jgi:hypothetical protein